MQQYNKKVWHWQNKELAHRDPSVLSSGSLIHHCNPAYLYSHTFTDRGCDDDPVIFLFHIKDIQNETNDFYF